MLRDAVAAAGVGVLPGVELLMAVPPGRGAGAGDEPEEAGGGAATAVGVVPVMVHGKLRMCGCVADERGNGLKGTGAWSVELGRG